MRSAMLEAIKAAARRMGATTHDLAMAVELLEKAERSPLAARELEAQLGRHGPGTGGLLALGLAGLEAEAEGDPSPWTATTSGLQGAQDSGVLDAGDAGDEPPTVDSSAADSWLAQQDRLETARARVRDARTDQDLKAAQAELASLNAPPAPRPIEELLGPSENEE